MRLTFLGHSAWGLEVDGQRVVVDPYPISSVAADGILEYASTGCACVLVTHGADDHLGLALRLVQENPDAVLISEPAVIRHSKASGVDAGRCHVLAWNGERLVGGWHVRAVEVRHTSFMQLAGGETITGMPLGFVVWHESEPEVRIIHLGDTSLFSDLQLLGMLYRPVVALIGVGAALGFFAEMTPAEGAQAALWLGVDIALPMHCEADPAEADAFCAAVRHLPRKLETWVPLIGRTFSVSRRTTIENGA